MVETISTSLKPESKLNVYTTMGVDPKEVESGAVRLPIDFVRYVLTAYQKAEELARGQNFVLRIGQNDLGRLLLANPDLQQVEEVLSGHVEDDYTKKLLDVSRIRNFVVKAVYEIFGLKHVSEPFSLIEMLKQDEAFRQTMMEYFSKTIASSNEVIYADPSRQKPLLAGLIAVLPRRVRKELTSSAHKAVAPEELEARAKKEILYPLSEASFATHVIGNNGYYIAQEGIETKEHNATIARVLREVGCEIQRVLFANENLAKDISERWCLYPELDGLAFNTSGGGTARHVDPYYAEQGGHLDPVNARSPESQSYKLLIYPTLEAQRTIDVYIGPDKPGLSTSLQEVILQGVKPVLREFSGIPGDGLDILIDLVQKNRKVRHIMTSLVTGGPQRLQAVGDWLSFNSKDKRPVFPDNRKQWFISMYISLAKQIEEEVNKILSDVK